MVARAEDRADAIREDPVQRLGRDERLEVGRDGIGDLCPRARGVLFDEDDDPSSWSVRQQGLRSLSRGIGLWIVGVLGVDGKRHPGDLGDPIADEGDVPDGAGVEEPRHVVDDLLGRRFGRRWRVGGTEGCRAHEKPRRDERGEPEAGDCVA